MQARDGLQWIMKKHNFPENPVFVKIWDEYKIDEDWIEKYVACRTILKK